MKKLMTILIALSLVVFLGCSKEQAEDMAANAKEKAGEATEAAKDAGYDAAETVKNAATDVGENAKELAGDAADGMKAAGDRIASTADAAAAKVASVIPAGSHEVGCGKCMYKMAGVTGCDAAVLVDGKAMLITGNTIDCHQYGLCSGTKVAKVEGKVVGDQFAATKVTIN